MKATAFGEQLVIDGLLSSQQLRQALAAQEAGGGRLDTTVLEMGYVREETLLQALGKFHRTRTASVQELSESTPEVARMISPRVARRFEIVPFRLEGKKLSVASLNPGDLLAEDEVALLTGCMVTTYAAIEVRVYEALARLYGVPRGPRLISVSKRLAEGAVARPAPPPAPEVPAEPPAVPVSERPETPVLPPPEEPPAAPPLTEPLPPEPPPAETPGPPGIARPRPPEPRRQVVTELEIDTDELELFPSLRAATEPDTGAADPGAAAPAEVLVEVPVEVPVAEVPGTAPVEVPAAAAEAPLDQAFEIMEEETDPDLRLITASERLLNAEMRDDIADALLAYCAPFLRRRALFILRQDQVVGWRGEGLGIETEAVRTVAIPTNEPSVFLGLVQGAGFWLGSLPPMPRNRELITGLGGGSPPECVVLPVQVKAKPVCFLYGDNAGGNLGDLPMPQLRRLVNKAGVAFQVYILKSKIRTM